MPEVFTIVTLTLEVKVLQVLMSAIGAMGDDHMLG